MRCIRLTQTKSCESPKSDIEVKDGEYKGTYPGRKGGTKDGEPLWVQGVKFPELAIFNPELAPEPQDPDTGPTDDSDPIPDEEKDEPETETEPETGGGPSEGGDTDNTGGSTNTGSDTTPVDSDTTPVTVPGGNVTVPSDTVIDESTGVATLPSGGEITLADGATALIVPPDTTIDLDTGIITVTQSGVVTVPASDVPDGLGIEFVVPSGTTIDPATGIMSVAADAGALTLPGTDGATGSDQDNIQVIVPDGTTIDPATGMVTAVDGGRTVLPGPNRKIEPESTRRSSRGAAADDDLEFYVTPGTTVDPYTGSVRITNGGEITLHDGTTVTVAPGTTIDPFTGVRNEPDATNDGSNNTGTTDLTDAGGSSGGCDAGMAGFALLATAAGAVTVLRRRSR